MTVEKKGPSAHTILKICFSLLWMLLGYMLGTLGGTPGGAMRAGG